MTKAVAALGLAACVLLGQTATAAEITVLAAGAVEPGLRSAAVSFEKGTGHSLTIEFAPAPQIRMRIAGGEMRDVVIATPVVLDELAQSGRIENVRVTLGRVGMGVAVRAGAPIPDISSVETFTRSLLAAEALVFTRGSSGMYFEGLLKKLGLYDQVAGRISRQEDGDAAMARVLSGKGRDVSVGQLTEIRLYRDKGVRLVGPLPADVQNYTTYAAAPTTARANAEAARALVTHLGSPGVRAMFAAAGIEP